MIYLIGGAPRIGKSILGAAMSQRTQSMLLSTDDLCDQVTKNMSNEEKNILFPWESFSGNPQENILSPEIRIKQQYTSAKSLEPFIDSELDHALIEEKSIIVEGVHLLPEYAHRLIQKRISSISIIFIGDQNSEHVFQGIKENTNLDNWLRESDNNVIQQVAEFVAAFSTHLKIDAQKYHLPYLERTSDFKKDLESYCDRLLNSSLT